MTNTEMTRAALKMAAALPHRRESEKPKTVNTKDLERLLLNAFPGVRLHAAILVLLQRRCLDGLHRYGDRHPALKNSASDLLEKVTRLMTKRENRMTKDRALLTKAGNLRPSKRGNGDEIGKAIDALPDKDRVWLILYKLDGGQVRTPNELQKMAGNRSSRVQWKRLLKELEIPYIDDKKGPKGPRTDPKQ